MDLVAAIEEPTQSPPRGNFVADPRIASELDDLLYRLAFPQQPLATNHETLQQSDVNKPTLLNLQLFNLIHEMESTIGKAATKAQLLKSIEDLDSNPTVGLRKGCPLDSTPDAETATSSDTASNGSGPRNVLNKKRKIHCSTQPVLDITTFAKTLPRKHLITFLVKHWGKSLYTHCSLPSSSGLKVRLLETHLYLLNFDVGHPFSEWRKVIALIVNRRGFESFKASAKYQRQSGEETRSDGETDDHVAYNRYLRFIYNGPPEDDRIARDGLAKHLSYERRWDVFISGYVHLDGRLIPGLGAGFILKCSDSANKKISRNTRYTTDYLKGVLLYIHKYCPEIVRSCRALKSTAEGFINDYVLGKEGDITALAAQLKEDFL